MRPVADWSFLQRRRLRVEQEVRFLSPVLHDSPKRHSFVHMPLPLLGEQHSEQDSTGRSTFHRRTARPFQLHNGYADQSSRPKSDDSKRNKIAESFVR